MPSSDGWTRGTCTSTLPVSGSRAIGSTSTSKCQCVPLPPTLWSARMRARWRWLGGPIVYCAEERDNGANLDLLHPDGNALSGDASRVKSEPFTFQAGAYLDDPQAEGYPDSLFCLVQPWRKRDEGFPGRGLKATITQALCGF